MSRQDCYFCTEAYSGIGFQHSSKYLLLCSTVERKSYRFGTTWERVNYRIFIFGCFYGAFLFLFDLFWSFISHCYHSLSTYGKSLPQNTFSFKISISLFYLENKIKHITLNVKSQSRKTSIVFSSQCLYIITIISILFNYNDYFTAYVAPGGPSCGILYKNTSEEHTCSPIP